MNADPQKQAPMSLKRRHFLIFLGAGAGAFALQPLIKNAAEMTETASHPNFTPLQSPMPLPTDAIARNLKTISPDLAQSTAVPATASTPVADYQKFTVQDDLVLPPEFTYEVLAEWGDRVGDGRFGYNNDYLGFVPTSPTAGYLTVNHEYISAVPWLQTYETVIGQALPLDPVKQAVAAAGKQGLNAFALPAEDTTKAQIREICQAALTELGMSVLSIQQTPNGQWVRTPTPADRRISGTAGLTDGHYLKATGPAAAVFRKPQGKGYIDGLGDRIIGTNSNCAGGTTPWGTVFSAEENFQNYFPEAVYADGTPSDPAQLNFSIDDTEVYGLGNVFGLAGNKYGWMVEVDPANPNDYGTKHTWLGRYRHEAVAVQALPGQRLAMYSGCDRRGGHLYKFVSQAIVQNPTDKANSRLLENGMLYAAKFNPDGTGTWLPLQAETPINPDLPSLHVGQMITLPNPDRSKAGHVSITEDAAIAAYQQQFKTLGDLYTGNPEEQQGAILIDAHYAANAIGATCTGRPEDTEISPTGALLITFTSGSADSRDGSPDGRVFKGPQGQSPWEFGWIMRLDEDNRDPAALTFRWSMFAAGGEPAAGGLGFANPDNLAFDSKGNLWLMVDMSSDKLNTAVPAGRKAEGKPVSQSNLRGVFGNNSIWYIPTTGAHAGEAFLFGYVPMDSEGTGPCFSPNQDTLFLAVQHPGEVHGMRRDMAIEVRQLAMTTPDGQEFLQQRQVPIGSNWPSRAANLPPKPAIVAIRRIDGRTFV